MMAAHLLAPNPTMRKLLACTCLVIAALPVSADVVIGSASLDEQTRSIVIHGSGFVFHNKPVYVYVGSPPVPLLVARASANEVVAAWSLDFQPGNYLLTVGYGLGSTEFDQAWISLGPPGIPGPPGPPGPALASLASLSGLACTVGTAEGSTRVDVAATGAVSMTCVPASTPSPADGRLMFTSSATYDGNLGGMAGADALCNSLATAAGLSTGYRAWLSGAAIDASSRFTSDGRPLVNVAGGRIADSLAALTAGVLLQRAPNVDEHGVSLANSPVALAWTATKSDGTTFGQTCATAAAPLDWTDASSARTLAGSIDATNGSWTQSSIQPCGSALHLYCIGP